ncbi:phosphatidylglycerophosphate synthase [Nakamurella sp. UYEF19]|uniref:CDP-alcohol phosphatidyltransferase family protein n=1 Tax=Nakamurella sp. UYEF19 TaxID=1756392 RepID=UPI003397AE8B
MLDARARRLLSPGLDAVGGRLAAAGAPAIALTAAGWLAGVAACVAVVAHVWLLALALWLLNRLLDGLDGPVARRHGPSDLGGFLDIVADFSIYSGFVVAVAIAEPGARLAGLALLMAYYLSGTAFLALSSLLERRGTTLAVDGRSLRFVGGLAEGTETVVVYVLLCLLPGRAPLILWLFTAAVAITAIQRVVLGVHTLRHPATTHPNSAEAAERHPAPRQENR